MKIGRTEKIVIISVSALALITIVHFVLYGPQSGNLSKINKDWDVAANQYKEYYKYDLSKTDVDKLDAEVAKLSETYDKATQVFQPTQYADSTRGIPAVLNALQTLKQTEKKVSKTNVRVFANWNITDDVPGLDSKRIPDYLDDLKNKKAILRLPNLDPALKQEFTAKYTETKRKLGFNMAELNQLPPLVSYLKQLKIFSYLKSSLGDYRITDRELLDLLELSDPKLRPANVPSYVFILKSADNLLKMAIDSEVESVSALNLDPQEPVYHPSKKPAAAPATTQPTVPGFPGRPLPLGMPSPLMEGPQEGPMFGRRAPGMFPGMPGMPGPQVAPAAPAAPAEKPLAIAWPIEIRFIANNLTFNKFLYTVSNAPDLAEVKEIEIKTLEEGKVSVRCKVDFYTNFQAS